MLGYLLLATLQKILTFLFNDNYFYVSLRDGIVDIELLITIYILLTSQVLN